MSDNNDDKHYSPSAAIGPGIPEAARAVNPDANEAAFNEALAQTSVEVVKESAPSNEKKRAKFSDVHTAETTSFHEPQQPRPSTLGTLTPEQREAEGFMTVFLGNSKKDVLAAQELISRWLQVEYMRQQEEEERVEASAVQAAETSWKEFLEERYPGKTMKEMSAYAANLFQFMNEVQDQVRVRSRVVTEEGISNVSDRGDHITSDIVGQKPGRGTKNFKVSEIMRRTASKTADDKLQFDVLLRDSFVKLNFMRPSKMEMADLINNIRRTTTGYVRTINNNSVVLARMAAQMEIWNFLSQRIQSCSISDIVDFSDLVNFITITDMDRLVVALLESFNTRGVNMNLRCLSDSCDWETFSLIDPSSLSQNRPGIPPADAALYANLFNGRVKLTAEETHAKRRASLFGVDDNRVYNDDRTMYLEVSIPTLAEAWGSFEYFISKINPELANLRSKIVDKEEYDTQVGLTYSALGSTEYLHWVSAYVNLGKPGTEEEDIVFRRHEVEDPEFDEGIFSVINDHQDLNRNLTKFILNKTPYMSRHFTGVSNYECPKCKARSEDHQDVDNYLDRRLGYTPICPIMSFFTLTQLKMISQLVVSNKVMKEVHSE